MKQDNGIYILGAGGIGTFLSFRFSKANIDHKVITRDNNPSKTKISVIEDGNKEKLFLDSINIPSNKIKILFICTKQYNLLEAILALKDYIMTKTLIIPLLNGFKHYKTIEDNINSNLVYATIGGINSSRLEGICTIKTSNLKIEFSGKLLNEEFDFLSNLFQKLNIDYKFIEDRNFVIWNKLSRLSIVSALTALSNKNLGFVKKDKMLNSYLDKMINEISSLNIKLATGLDKKIITSQIDKMPDNLETSLQRDINSKNISELDSLIGDIIDFGDKLNCKMVTYKLIYTKLKNK